MSRHKKDCSCEICAAKREPEVLSTEAPFSLDVREPIKQMTGFSTEGAMAASLPEDTMTNQGDTTEPPPARRKRRSKAEMEAFRAGQPSKPPSFDPNMDDPRYRRAVEKMRAGSGTAVIKGGFKGVALGLAQPEIALEPEEELDVEDFFYVMSKRSEWLDPTKSGWTMAIYFFGLLGTLIFKRVAHSQADEWTNSFKRWFGMEEKAESLEQGEEKKS